MNPIEIILIILIAAAVTAAVIVTVRKKKNSRGCSCGCEGCCLPCERRRKK